MWFLTNCFPHHICFCVYSFYRLASSLSIQGNVSILKNVKPTLLDHLENCHFDGEVQVNQNLHIKLCLSGQPSAQFQQMPLNSLVNPILDHFGFGFYSSCLRSERREVQRANENTHFFECLLLQHMVASTPFSHFQTVLFSSFLLLLPFWVASSPFL